MPDADVLVLEPGADGALELARRLRRRRPDAPIVCVSIFSPTAEQRALEPIAYLRKPFAIGAFECALEAAVHGNRERACARRL